MWNECNCVVVWTFFGVSLLWNWNKNGLFQSCGHCWVFQICWHIEYSVLTAWSFKIGNNWAGIPSPSLALFIAMLPKAHLTSCSRMSGSLWVTTPWWLSRTLRLFLYSYSVYSWQFFLIPSVRSLPFMSWSWSTGGGNGNALQYSCLKNPMDSIKRLKDVTLQDEPPGQKVFNVILGNSRGQLLIAPEGMKWVGQSRNGT